MSVPAVVAGVVLGVVGVVAGMVLGVVGVVVGVVLGVVGVVFSRFVSTHVLPHHLSHAVVLLVGRVTGQSIRYLSHGAGMGVSARWGIHPGTRETDGPDECADDDDRH